MTLSDLISIKNARDLRQTCKDYLTLIGGGSSRAVFRLNSNQVIKVARHNYGYTQNASECDTFDTYKGLNLFADIINRADDYLWVIQPLATPLSNDDARFKQIVDVVDHVKCSKEYLGDDVLMQKLYAFLVETEWKFLGDIAKPDSWGIINGELRMIDYGMNNEAYKEYFG